MPQDQNAQDPLEFVRGMWSSMGFNLPGMVTPTLDVDELDKRIADLKAVENWLKMNLNMLQMSIQGLEMQRAAIGAVKAMCEHAREADSGGKTDSPTPPNPFAAATSMWPWNLMAKPAEAAPTPRRWPPRPLPQRWPPPRNAPACLSGWVGIRSAVAWPPTPWWIAASIPRG